MELEGLQLKYFQYYKLRSFILLLHPACILDVLTLRGRFVLHTNFSCACMVIINCHFHAHYMSLKIIFSNPLTSGTNLGTVHVQRFDYLCSMDSQSKACL